MNIFFVNIVLCSLCVFRGKIEPQSNCVFVEVGLGVYWGVLQEPILPLCIILDHRMSNDQHFVSNHNDAHLAGTLFGDPQVELLENIVRLHTRDDRLR